MRKLRGHSRAFVGGIFAVEGLGAFVAGVVGAATAASVSSIAIGLVFGLVCLGVAFGLLRRWEGFCRVGLILVVLQLVAVAVGLGIAVSGQFAVHFVSEGGHVFSRRATATALAVTVVLFAWMARVLARSSPGERSG